MIAHTNRQRAKAVKTVLSWMALLMLFISLHAFAQSTGTVTYVYTDPQGTPLAEADANGNITATFDYTPYGTFAPSGTSNPGPDPKGPGYTGHVNDPETNLVYMQARYYDPATGHFLSVDPIATTAGNTFDFNRYAYANNNPIRNVDLNGKESATLTLQGIAAIETDPVTPTEATYALGLEFSVLGGPVVAEALGIVRTAAEVGAVSTVRTRADIMKANADQGKAGEAIVRAKLGDNIAGEQVTIKTSDGTRTRADFVTKDKDVVEAKTGNAQLSPGQAKLKADIDAGRPVTPVGKNASKAGFQPGQPTTMKSCTVTRC